MDCVMGSGCQRAQICSLTMLHVSHPYLISLSFYTIPICLFLFKGFFIYLLMYGAMIGSLFIIFFSFFFRLNSLNSKTKKHIVMKFCCT